MAEGIEECLAEAHVNLRDALKTSRQPKKNTGSKN